MGLKSEDRQIGEHTYRVTQLGVTSSVNLLTALVKMVGPSLGHVIDGAETKGKGLAGLLDAEIKGDVFSKAIAALTSRLEAPQVQAIMATLRDQTQVNENSAGDFKPLKLVYEMHFAGRMADLFAWLRFALEVQYGDFLPLLAASAPRESAGAVAAPAASEFLNG